jgi:Ca2+-binding RTX toxin-like protein
MSDDATNGIDNIVQTNGNDTLNITSPGQLNDGDAFNGGAGKDTISISPSGEFDFTAGTINLLSYEALTFAGNSQAEFAASQFGSGLISTSLHVTGQNGFGQGIVVTILDTSLNFSAAHWTFANWRAGVEDNIGIYGNALGNTLTGSSQDDGILGQAGADILIGGKGRDVLDGGADTDTFKYNKIAESKKGATHRDVIEDFALGEHIDLKKIDANTKVAHNQAFHFIGAHHFHHKAGELHFVVQDLGGGEHDVVVEGDVNGDGRADFQIEVTNDLDNLTSLARGDFIL